MDDWKAQIDAWEPGKHRRAQGRSEHVSVHDAPETQASVHRRRWGQEHTLAVHQRRFRCHICSKPSAGPRAYSAVRLAWTAKRLNDEDWPSGVAYE